MSEDQVKAEEVQNVQQEQTKEETPATATAADTKQEGENGDQSGKRKSDVPATTTPKKPKRTLTAEEEDAELKYALEEPLEDEEEDFEEDEEDTYGGTKAEESSEEEGPVMARSESAVLTRRGRRSVSSFGADIEEESYPFGLQWKNSGSLHYLTSSELKPTAKIAAFDLDGTLIVPKRGKKPANRKDWKWVFPQIPDALKKLRREGYNIVIFSEQYDTANEKQKLADVKGKIVDMCKELGYPMQALIATAPDRNRKPYSTMFDFFVEQLNGKVQPDNVNSLYVGEEAGRPDKWKDSKTKRDLSATDRNFAYNIGLPFKTPEEFFLNEKPAPFSLDTIFDPSQFMSSLAPDTPLHTGEGPLHSTEQELLVLVGPPVSGKTTFAKKHILPHNYTSVSGKNVKEVVKKVTDALDKGTSVVIDDTNGTPQGRSHYINLAKSKNIPCRAFVMQTSGELARHLNYYRERTTTDVEPETENTFARFEKSYKEPTVEEGFTEVKKINFIPQFENDQQKRIFMQRFV